MQNVIYNKENTGNLERQFIFFDYLLKEKGFAISILPSWKMEFNTLITYIFILIGEHVGGL